MNGIRSKNVPDSYFNYIYNNSLDDEQELQDLNIWSESNCMDIFSEE